MGVFSNLSKSHTYNQFWQGVRLRVKKSRYWLTSTFLILCISFTTWHIRFVSQGPNTNSGSGKQSIVFVLESYNNFYFMIFLEISMPIYDHTEASRRSIYIFANSGQYIRQSKIQFYKNIKRTKCHILSIENELTFNDKLST